MVMGSRDILAQARALCEVELLPVALCLVEPEPFGRILCANARFVQLFGPSAVGRKAVKFYQDPADRERFLAKLTSVTKGGGLDVREESLRLTIDGQPLVVKDFTKILRNEKGEVAGHLSCLIEYAEEDHALGLVHDLPVGIFGLDAEDALTFYNQRLAELFGCPDRGELQSAFASEAVLDREEGQRLRRALDQDGSVRDYRLELVRGNKTFIGSVTALRIPREPDRPYAGCEGAIIDVTSEEGYRHLIDEMPIALFELRREGEVGPVPREIITYCNPAFASINGYETVEEVLRRPIEDFHQSRESYQEALASFEEREAKHDETPVELPIRKRRGEEEVERSVSVNARFVRDRAGRVIGRLGVSRDVTDERGLREWNELLTRDIGNLLHSYSSSMMSLRHTLDLSLELSGESPFGDVARAGALEKLLEHFEKPRLALADALSELLEKRQEKHAAGAWQDEDWDALGRNRKLLAFRVRHLPEELRYATLRQIAAECLAVLSRLEAGRLPREFEKRARVAAMELRRLGTQLALLLAKGKIVELGDELRAVREVVTRRSRRVAEWEILRIEELVRGGLAEVAEYAQSRDVQLRSELEEDALGAEVEGDERDLARAIGNIFHNAVKYSWHREAGAYATVRMSIGGGKVVLEVVNYGVPIPPDELELVFKIGVRGRFSGDRRRVGTGIGLWDAQWVARNHQGRLTIESRPASSGRDKNDFQQPFLTTVRLELPLVQGTGGSRFGR